MTISKEFLSLFSNFITNYKQNGIPTFYTWLKEQNHGLISDSLAELFTIVTVNQESLHDASIIENLSITALLSAKSNPYLLTCWIDFLNEYNASTKQYAPIGTIALSVGPSGVPSENMIRNLKDALVAQQATLESTQKIHQAEMEQLRKQISDLQTANGQLRLQNDQLKVLTHDRHVIEALHPQIQKNQEQLASFSTLLNTLYELTKAKPIPEVLNSTEINAQRPVTEPITGNNNSAKEIQDKAQIVTSRIAGKAIEPPKEQSPPPAPPSSSAGRCSTPSTK